MPENESYAAQPATTHGQHCDTASNPFSKTNASSPSDAKYNNLLLLHQAFATNVAELLSEWLGCNLEMTGNRCHPARLPDDAKLIRSTHCEFQLLSKSHDTPWIVFVGRSFLMAFVNRLLGIRNTPNLTAQRKLSPFECRLSKHLMAKISSELAQAWRPLIDCQWDCHCQDALNSTVRIPSDDYVVVDITVEILGYADSIFVCVPKDIFNRTQKKLASITLIDMGRSTSLTANQIASKLDETIATLIVKLAETTIKTSDIISLQVGDIIATEIPVDSPLEVAIGNTVKFRASPGSLKGRKAIQVQEIIEPVN
jgi:flagellar motor switch protein FliM